MYIYMYIYVIRHNHQQNLSINQEIPGEPRRHQEIPGKPRKNLFKSFKLLGGQVTQIKVCISDFMSQVSKQWDGTSDTLLLAK